MADLRDKISSMTEKVSCRFRDSTAAFILLLLRQPFLKQVSQNIVINHRHSYSNTEDTENQLYQ